MQGLQEDTWAEKVFEKKDRVVARKIADEIVLVPIRENARGLQRIFTLNPVAQYVWEHIDGKAALGDIRDMVLEEFDVSRDTAGDDIREFIGRLNEEDLLKEI